MEDAALPPLEAAIQTAHSHFFVEEDFRFADKHLMQLTQVLQCEDAVSVQYARGVVSSRLVMAYAEPRSCDLEKFTFQQVQSPHLTFPENRSHVNSGDHCVWRIVPQWYNCRWYPCKASTEYKEVVRLFTLSHL